MTIIRAKVVDAIVIDQADACKSKLAMWIFISLKEHVKENGGILI